MNDKEILAVVFGSSIIIIALFFAILASTTTILYKNKSVGKLSSNELKIINGRATIGDRISVFLYSIFKSFITPHVFIIAGIFTLIVWVFLLFI